MIEERICYRREAPHNLLRAEMMKQGWSVQELAKMIDRSQSYFSLCLNFRNPWKSYEMYQMMDALKIPYERLHEIFPPNPYIKKETAT